MRHLIFLILIFGVAPSHAEDTATGGSIGDKRSEITRLRLEQEADEIKTVLQRKNRVVLPRVKYISGFGDQLIAVLVFADNTEAEVSDGTALPNGMIVSKINVHSVFVNDKGRVSALPSYIDISSTGGQ